ncbi:FAD-dependent oxidoreductase [Streptomyces sp. GC420]|uniref:FAD-dependent oxidoreductase n=1 Tax=Streptomyces sp. GC420 TaxID=2697568 RepID=UPI0014151BB4|nr:FAD-dependent oxidoreductase [Streptomyces sp. GC420]NBM19440.1 FAD-binding protein [Streptomyces sp. GC420]
MAGSTRDTPRTRPSDTADVLIVGAGPTGMTLAGDLAAAGLAATVLEKRPPGTSNLTRAFGVHARTLEQLDARGLADELVARGRQVTELRVFNRLSLDLGRLRTRFPFLLVTPQYEVERLLGRRALEAGACFRYGTEVTALRQDANGVEAVVREEDGTARTLRARYLVGADGVHSAVRELLGLPFPGASVIKSIVLADVRLAEEPESLLTVNGTGGTFAFVVPFGDGWYRVMGWDRGHQVPDSEPADLDEVRRIARTALGTDFGMHDARWISRFHSDERQVPAYRDKRVFLAGDAAHVHSPAGGQGMNTGIQDAVNLGWKLAAVVRGQAPDTLLDTYQSERHPVGLMVLRSSGAIVRLAMAHTPLQRAARSLAYGFLGTVMPAAHRAMGMISGTGIAYSAPRRAHPLTGRRAPDIALAGGTRLYETLRGGRFVLVTPRGEAPGEAADGTSGPPDLFVHAHWAGPRRTALLVRPDGYIAWATDEKDPARRATALRTALRTAANKGMAG